MKSNVLLKMARKGATLASKNAPIILAGLAAAGVVVTFVEAVKATRHAEQEHVFEEYKALREKIDEQTKNEDPEVKREMMKKLIKKAAKKVIPIYAPAVISGVMTIACIFGCHSVNHRRQVALATAYNLTESTLSNYQAKAKELLGNKKETEIRDAIAKDKVDANPVNDKTIIVTGNGDVLCHDEMSGRYFKSNPEAIRKVVNSLNERLLTEMFIPLNDLYYELGLKRIDLGDDLGFDINYGLIDVRYSSMLNENGEPVLSISYVVKPRYNFGDLQ